MMMATLKTKSDRELYYMYGIKSHNLLMCNATKIDSNIYTLKSFMSIKLLDEFTRYMWKCSDCTHKILGILICSKCSHENNDDVKSVDKRLSYRMLIRRIQKQIRYTLHSDVCTHCFRKRVAEHLYQLPVSFKYYTRKRKNYQNHGIFFKLDNA